MARFALGAAVAAVLAAASAAGARQAERPSCCSPLPPLARPAADCLPRLAR